MTSGERMHQLGQKLLRLTQAGKLQWEATIDEDLYITAFPDYSVSVRGGESRAGLLLHNSEGRLMDTFLPDDYDEKSVINELYAEARRNALGADRALDDLFARLEKIA